MSARSYEENSSVWWALLLYGVAFLLALMVTWFLTARREILDDPNGSLAVIMPSGLIVVFVAIGWTASRWFVRFTGAELSFGFRHWNKSFLLFVHGTAPTERVGLWTFGGAGWRIGRGGRIGYIKWFGPAVEVETPKRRYVFSCENPEAMVAALARAGVPTPAASASAG